MRLPANAPPILAPVGPPIALPAHVAAAVTPFLNILDKTKTPLYSPIILIN